MKEEPAELYRKHRPTKLSEVLGQEGVVKSLTDLGKRKKVPHCLMLSGPSGCGKTTIARILTKKLRCSDHDFHEVNAAQTRGIDMVRDIQSRVGQSPIGGRCRVWLIDEVHATTKDAQTAFLKLLEDTPRHVYFMLCTTDPNKLLKTIRTRTTEFRVKPLKADAMRGLLEGVCEKESAEVSEEVVDKIVEVSEGSPRKALVWLGQVIGLGSEREQLAEIEAGGGQEAIALARALVKPKATWAEVSRILKGLKEAEEDPEGLRYMVLYYCMSILLGGGPLAKRARFIVDCFRDNLYDSKWAGLVANCHEVVVGE
jgi:DNA polymerase-3 subunit gamma/tau